MLLGTQVYLSDNCESDQEGDYNGRDSYDTGIAIIMTMQTTMPTMGLP
jgi:hypothetical protein